MKLMLGYNNAYKWYSNDDYNVIGYAYYNDVLYTDEKFLKLVKDIKNIEKEIKHFFGFFSIVIKKNSDVTIISDRLRTFPVFYQVKNRNIIISDNINNFESSIDETNIKELLTCKHVTGNNTLLTDVSELEGSQIVNICNGKINRNRYYNYDFSIKDDDNKIIFKNLDSLYNKAIKKLIKYADGAQIVVPLSGGQDSRLIVYYLYKNKYPNVLTYTYGIKNSEEVKISKQVANCLHLKWIFVEYKNKNLRKKFNDKKAYSSMANYMGRGFSIPLIQEWEAIDYLTENSIISTDAVIVPGYSGDFIAGSHVLPKFDRISRDDIFEKVCLNNYTLLQHDNKDYYKKVEPYFDNKKEFKYEEACNGFERAEFFERLAKYVVNACRTYDYYGLKWYMPFWDNELVDYWLTIPLEKKYKRELYIKFTENYYPKELYAIPCSKHVRLSSTKGSILKKIKRVYEIYYNQENNFYGYLYFSTYVLYILKTKKIDPVLFWGLKYVEYFRNGK